MEALLKADFFEKNRHRLLDLYPDHIIILSGNSHVQKSLDQNYPFHQDNNFWYFCGLDLADLILVFSKTTQFIILPKQNKYQQIFDGFLDKEQIQRVSGIFDVLDQSKAVERLKQIFSKNPKVGTVIYPKLKYLTRLNQQNHLTLISYLKRIKPDISINNLSQGVARLRMVKSPKEIKLINKASKITIDSIAKIEQNLQKYVSSDQISKDLRINLLKEESDGYSFDPIIASGRDSTIIHFNKSNSDILKNKLLLLDVGCFYHKYASDISRTIPVGRVTKREKEVQAAVLRVQAQLINFLEPGKSFKDIEAFSRKLIFRELINLKILTNKQFSLVNKYYPHAVTHSLGLDVHDFADYSINLAPNMVITIEPGIYLPTEGIGVRFEDDILITKKGSKILR